MAKARKLNVRRTARQTETPPPANVLYRIRFYGEVQRDRDLHLEEARSPVFYRGTVGDYLVHRTGWARCVSLRCAWCRIRCISVRKRAAARYGRPATCPACLRRFVIDGRRAERITYPIVLGLLAICGWRSYVSGAFAPLAGLMVLHVVIEGLLTLLAPQRRQAP